MKKEGIMRINSYNKFFAEVAKIMSTDIKAVKQLDGRYKVELANHVYLNVYRGVSGTLFVHSHRGISHITSCYDFEDFKTMKDLYERLITDYSTTEETEETETNVKDVMEVKQNLNTEFGKEISKTPLVLDVMQCMMCKADRQGNRCGGKEWCNETWKRYATIINPEWHHVSLATLANIDRDMLDEKRQCYMYLYHLLKDFRKYAVEISRREVYFDLVRNVTKDIQQMYFNNKISIKAYNYASRHIELVSVEKNYFQSKSEQAFGYKESKRYSITLR